MVTGDAGVTCSVVRPEQKRVEWIKFVAQKFWKPIKLVVYPWAGTFATSKSFMLL